VPRTPQMTRRRRAAVTGRARTATDVQRHSLAWFERPTVAVEVPLALGAAPERQEVVNRARHVLRFLVGAITTLADASAAADDVQAATRLVDSLWLAFGSSAEGAAAMFLLEAIDTGMTEALSDYARAFPAVVSRLDRAVFDEAVQARALRGRFDWQRNLAVLRSAGLEPPSRDVTEHARVKALQKAWSRWNRRSLVALLRARKRVSAT
jgi:hypothetical protein